MRTKQKTKVKKWIERKCLVQRDLANYLKVDDSAITHFVNGRCTSKKITDFFIEQGCPALFFDGNKVRVQGVIMAMERFAKVFELEDEQAQILFYIKECIGQGACLSIMTLKNNICRNTRLVFDDNLTEEEKFKTAQLKLYEIDKIKAKNWHRKLMKPFQRRIRG